MRGLSSSGAVFIARMIEGGFPLRTSHAIGSIRMKSDVRLQKHGIFLEDISTDTLLKEEHYFYQTACRATERLYLTRPLALNDGAETVASYYIEELRRAIVPALIEVKQIRGDIEWARSVRSFRAVQSWAQPLIDGPVSGHREDQTGPQPTARRLLSMAAE